MLNMMVVIMRFDVLKLPTLGGSNILFKHTLRSATYFNEHFQLMLDDKTTGRHDSYYFHEKQNLDEVIMAKI